MDTVIQVQTLDEAVCISYRTNSFGKGVNPTIPHSAMVEIVGQAELFSKPVEEKKNSEFKSDKIRLKINLLFHPARVKGLGKYSQR